MRRGGYLSFAGEFSTTGPTTTAGNAQIVLDGGASIGGYGGTASFSTWSTAGNATITAHGGTVAGAGGATINFDYVAHAGNATLVANGGTNGGAGGAIYFRRGATGDNARLVVNQGAVADFGGNLSVDFTSIGSIEGGGTFAINGTELRVGALNTSTTVSGSIVDALGTTSGGRLTKTGSGKLSLAGANGYNGLTTVEAGTLAINGSIAGGALVKNGATLSGTGTIAGPVTVAAGGIISPGSSPGTLSVGGLNLASTSSLDFEVGALSDRLAVNGNLTLDGILNISASSATAILDTDLVTYTGALTNNGLTIGAVPSGFSPTDFAIDISLPGRVRLIRGSATADYDGDGDVDGNDLVRWRSGFGTAGGASRGQGDSNADGTVDGADFLAWQRQLGSAATLTNSAVPEPGSLMMMTLGMLELGLRRGLKRSSRLGRSTNRKCEIGERGRMAS